MNEKDEPFSKTTATDGRGKKNELYSQIDSRGEIVLYQPEASLKLEVLVENESVWLNRQQISVLFDRDVKTISKHINNALNEELNGITSVAKFATHLPDGRTYQIEYFDLDVILSVGYRVKSKRGIQFRQWANNVLKDYLLRGHVIGRRLERIEYRLGETERKIDFFVRTALPPVQGIFFEGQIFDAHAFVSDLIRSAKRSVALIDNYVDESVLLLLSKRLPNVTAEIHTRRIPPELRLDLEKHNAQYEPVNVCETDRFHDRFLIVDDIVYHIGASFKDLGKKLFAFSKMETKGRDVLRAR